MNTKPWKGYNLNQLHIRQATTSLLIELEKQRLRYAASSALGFGSANKADKPANTGVSIFSIALFAIKATKIIKKLREKLRK